MVMCAFFAESRLKALGFISLEVCIHREDNNKRPTKRRHSGLKSGVVDPGFIKSIFPGKFQKTFDFFRQFHKIFDFFRQISEKFRFFPAS